MGSFFVEKAQLKGENETLNRALLLLDSLKKRVTRQSNKLLEAGFSQWNG